MSGTELEFLVPPVGKNVDDQLVVDLRRMLTSAGYRRRAYWRPCHHGWSATRMPTFPTPSGVPPVTALTRS